MSQFVNDSKWICSQNPNVSFMNLTEWVLKFTDLKQSAKIVWTTFIMLLFPQSSFTSFIWQCIFCLILIEVAAQLITATIFVTYENHQTANETKVERNRVSRLSCGASSEHVYSRADLDHATPLLYSTGRSSEKAFDFAAVLIISPWDLVGSI